MNKTNEHNIIRFYRIVFSDYLRTKKTQLYNYTFYYVNIISSDEERGFFMLLKCKKQFIYLLIT